MLGPAASLGIDPSVSRYLPNHTLSRGAPEGLTIHHQHMEEQHLAYQQQLAEEEAAYQQQQQEHEQAQLELEHEHQLEHEQHISASPTPEGDSHHHHQHYPPHHHPHGVPPPPQDGVAYEEDPHAQAYASSSHHNYDQSDMLDPSLRAHDPSMPTGIPMHDHEELERLEEAEVESRIGAARTTKRKRATARDPMAGPSDPVTGAATRSKGKKKRGAVAASTNQPQVGTIGTISAVDTSLYRTEWGCGAPRNVQRRDWWA